MPTIPEADLESTENKNLAIVHKAELERLKRVNMSKPELKAEKKLTNGRDFESQTESEKPN